MTYKDLLKCERENINEKHHNEYPRYEEKDK